MTLVLDASALIALERNDRAMWRRYKSAHIAGVPPRTHGGVVGRAWRGPGPREAMLARALAGVDVKALDETLGRRAGELLSRTARADVIDAALVLLAEDGDVILTSDPDDLSVLAGALSVHVELVRA